MPEGFGGGRSVREGERDSNRRIKKVMKKGRGQVRRDVNGMR